MRRKKHKQTRRATNYYRINYGFHEPYKVLLDGNFIHATRAINMGDLANHIPKLLGGTCKLYTTKCVSRELKAMGKDFAASAAMARAFPLHHCSHGGGGGGGGEGGEGQGATVPAAQCIRECIGSRNEHHWFVATQDAALRQELGKIPGCPLVFATVNGVHLETPSEVTKQKAKEAEAATQQLQQHEVAAAPLLAEVEALRPKLTTSVRFRKQKAKGPNPLSMKKKTKKPQQQQQQGSKGKAAEGGAAEGPKRKRQEGAQAEGPGGGQAADQQHKRRRKRAKGAADGGGSD